MQSALVGIPQPACGECSVGNVLWGKTQRVDSGGAAISALLLLRPTRGPTPEPCWRRFALSVAAALWPAHSLCSLCLTPARLAAAWSIARSMGCSMRTPTPLRSWVYKLFACMGGIARPAPQRRLLGRRRHGRREQRANWHDWHHTTARLGPLRALRPPAQPPGRKSAP